MTFAATDAGDRLPGDRAGDHVDEMICRAGRPLRQQKRLAVGHDVEADDVLVHRKERRRGRLMPVAARIGNDAEYRMRREAEQLLAVTAPSRCPTAGVRHADRSSTGEVENISFLLPCEIR